MCPRLPRQRGVAVPACAAPALPPRTLSPSPAPSSLAMNCTEAGPPPQQTPESQLAFAVPQTQTSPSVHRFRRKPRGRPWRILAEALAGGPQPELPCRDPMVVAVAEPARRLSQQDTGGRGLTPTWNPGLSWRWWLWPALLTPPVRARFKSYWPAGARVWTAQSSGVP